MSDKKKTLAQKLLEEQAARKAEEVKAYEEMMRKSAEERQRADDERQKMIKAEIQGILTRSLDQIRAAAEHDSDFRFTVLSYANVEPGSPLLEQLRKHLAAEDIELLFLGQNGIIDAYGQVMGHTSEMAHPDGGGKLTIRFKSGHSRSGWNPPAEKLTIKDGYLRLIALWDPPPKNPDDDQVIGG